MTASTTVVLVHGAFTDASTWWPVVLRLLGAGHRVLAPPVIGRSFHADCDYIRAFVERLEGSVLLVGHGYGAAVVTVAGHAANVKGLLFIAGYVPEREESIEAMNDLFAPAEASQHLVAATFQGDGASGTEITIAIDQYPYLMAEGLPDDETAVLAVSQRPISVAALAERAATDAWRTTPSWGVVATEDRAVSPELQRFGYQRARCREVAAFHGPHLVIQTHAAEIVRFIAAIVREIAADG
ncbi:alpha/beta fold hydrolase [Microbacterium sp. P01]|uniref:alpha/beta fold hydrolase n=1 Tax=unclassified Microbacterium TaxID=2609290 RepID=UPI00366D7BDF